MPRSRRTDADAVQFGRILRRLREERGWTKRTLAVRAELTPNFVAILEDGGNLPSLPTILELMDVLGADVGEVMRELAAARQERQRKVAAAAKSKPRTAG